MAYACWKGGTGSLKLCSGNCKEWDKFIPLTLFACRDAPHAATGLSPFEVMFGPWTYIDPEGALDHTEEYTCICCSVPPSTEGNVHNSQPRLFERGMATRNLVGMALVVEAISPVSYRIGTPGKKGAILHRNHLKRFVQSHHVSAVLLADGDIEDGDHLQLTLPVDSPTDKEITLKLGQDLSKEQTDQLLQLLEKYQNIFSEIPGTTDKLTFDIQTGDHQLAKVMTLSDPNQMEGQVENRYRSTLG